MSAADKLFVIFAALSPWFLLAAGYVAIKWGCGHERSSRERNHYGA
jgi:hypothetical protein